MLNQEKLEINKKIINLCDASKLNDCMFALNNWIPKINNIVIYGTENIKENIYLKTSINELNKNFKNPYDGIYYPDKYTDENLIDDDAKIEKELNYLLKNYLKLYYLRDTIGNCFIKNKTYYFLIFKAIKNLKEISLLEYQSITKINVKLDETNKNILTINWETIINFNMKINHEGKELSDIKGNFTHKSSNQYISSDDEKTIDEKILIFNIGKNFISSENLCRQKIENFYIKKLIFNLKKSKIDINKKENLEDIVKELKNLIIN